MTSPTSNIDGDSTRLFLTREARVLEFQTVNIRRRLVLPGGPNIDVIVDVELDPAGEVFARPGKQPLLVIGEITPRVRKTPAPSGRLLQ